MRQLIDLSHPIRIGEVTHPGLPAPEWDAFRSREDYSRDTGTEFQIDRVVMVGNTGTYLDSPFHRFRGGSDLAAVDLHDVADVPLHVVDARANRAVDEILLAEQLGDSVIEGHAVLLHTGGDAHFGSPEYGVDAPFLTTVGARWLRDRNPTLVGIDAVNIDDLADPARPAHTVLLGAGIYVLEHLTRLEALPARGSRLHAAPPAWHQIGTWPVRAYAVVAFG